MSARLIVADVLDGLASLEPESAQCVVTSPPYWGLRDYGVPGQLGLEASPRDYLRAMRRVFRAVRRVLRRDGTLWLNLGDCYATGAGRVGDCPGGGEQGARSMGVPTTQDPMGRGRKPLTQPNRLPQPGLKPKDLVGIPWRVALMLQRDGWWLRSDIIWSKPNPMPESVRDRPTRSHEYLFLLSKRRRYYYDGDAIREPHAADTLDRYDRAHSAIDVPGQPPQNGICGARENRRKASPPVSGWASGPGSHAAVDHNAGSNAERFERSRAGLSAPDYDKRKWEESSDGRSRPPMTMVDREYHPLGRNKRTVWEIATEPYPEAHFATFPTALVEPCILAGSSAFGACVACGAPWRRRVARRFEPQADVSLERGLKGAPGQKPMDESSGWNGYPRGTTSTTTIDWQRGCKCEAGVRPCLVLDPFAGSGTVGLVANRLGRDFVGVELNPEYARLAHERLRGDSPLFATVDLTHTLPERTE